MGADAPARGAATGGARRRVGGRRAAAGVQLGVGRGVARRRRRPPPCRSTRTCRGGCRAASRRSPRRSTAPASRSRGRCRPSSAGLYVRNGSNPRTGVSPHWFLGDGMVHGIRLEAGAAVSYANRYVRTPLYEASSGFGEGVPGGEASQSNVSAIWHGGKLLTSGEVGLPLRAVARRPQHQGRLRLRRPADDVDDRAPEDRPGDRADALLRLRLRAAVPHVPRRRRRRHPREEHRGARARAHDDPRLRHHRDRRRVLGPAGGVRPRRPPRR